MDEHVVRKALVVSESLWAQIDEFRFQQRLRTDQDVLRRLLEIGLSAGRMPLPSAPRLRGSGSAKGVGTLPRSTLDALQGKVVLGESPEPEAVPQSVEEEDPLDPRWFFSPPDKAQRYHEALGKLSPEERKVQLDRSEAYTQEQRRKNDERRARGEIR